MSRIIKFRAWNKVTRAMYYDHSVSISIGGSVHYLDLTGEWECDADANGEKGLVIELMQFTGLKDKNGVEIYEGDIVNTEDSGLARPEDVLAVKYSGGAFVIYNPNCCEICKKGSGCISNLDEWRVDKYIVIGNIYENAELLTEKTNTNDIL